MFKKTCSFNFLLVIVGLALITSISIYLESNGFYWHDTSYANKDRVKNITSPTTREASKIMKESTNTRRSTEDGLMKIFKHAGQLKYAFRHLLASAINIYDENDVYNLLKHLRKHLLPLINDIFNVLEEIIRNDDEDLKTLQNYVSDRIYKLQNPTNCSQARRMICNLKYVSCGLGCVLHHLAECFIVALGTNRTMIVNATELSYKGWSKVFRPISSCTNDDIAIENIIEYQGEQASNPTSDHLLIVKKSFEERTGTLYPSYTKFISFAMPAVIADKLSRAHNQPNAWWMGQLLRYMMRLQPRMLDAIDKRMKEIGFSHPIVCVHVRRGDKLKYKEALRYELSQYMIHVNNWYEQYDQRKTLLEISEKKVYLVTDEYGVVEEAKNNYTNYEFLHDPLIKKHANIKIRFTEEGLISIVSDVMILSKCDYFVGTLSSNIGLTVYELIQAIKDRTYDAISLDQTYHSMAINPFWHEAIAEHNPEDNDIALKVGDKITFIHLQPFFHKGYGRNQRTNRDGSYPMMKVKYLVRGENFVGF